MKVKLNDGFRVVSTTVRNGCTFTEKVRDIKVGNKRVVTTLKETRYKKEPSTENYGIGGDSLRIVKTDNVFNINGGLVGGRYEESEVLTTINDNGRIYIPHRPFVIAKYVIKQTVAGWKNIKTTFGYGNGFRTKKENYTTGEVINSLYVKGVPSKQ